MEADTLTTDMSTATARIAYDGELLRAGLMDVRDLAPALLELGALCERANEVLNGDRATLSVRVRADFRKGSFEIDLHLLQTLVEQVKGYIFGEQVANAKHIAELVGIAGSSSVTLLGLFKWLRGRRIKATKKLPGGGTQIIVNNTVVVNNIIVQGQQPQESIIELDPSVPISDEVLRIYQDEPSLRRLDGTLRPLLKEGIETFEVRSDSATLEMITKEEVRESAQFRPPQRIEPADKPLVDSTYEAALELVKIPFRGSNLVWSMALGDQKINAEMADLGFFERHKAGETRFGARDIMRVKLRTRTWRTPRGLETKHEILEVLDHIVTEPLQYSFPSIPLIEDIPEPKLLSERAGEAEPGGDSGEPPPET